MPQKTHHGSYEDRSNFHGHPSPPKGSSTAASSKRKKHSLEQPPHERHRASTSQTRRPAGSQKTVSEQTIETEDFTDACFLGGSLISTPDGEKPVEALKINDLILTSEGLAEKLTWVGKSRCTVQPNLPDDLAGWPVRIRAGAIADCLPHTDLLVTAEHCIFLDGGFIPARMLINGVSIFWDRKIQSYEYFHIETETHVIILANGLLTESYLDTGNRKAFRQTGQLATLRSCHKTWEKDAAAPLMTSRAKTEPAWQAIAKRAGVDGFEAFTTSDPALHLLLPDGSRLYPSRESNGYTIFTLPQPVRSVRLLSRADRPCDVTGPYVDDRRTLGVLVRNIILFDSFVTRRFTDHLTSQTSDSGWLTDQGSSQCWTDGDAVLFINAEGPCTLALEIIGGGPYVLSPVNFQLRRAG